MCFSDILQYHGDGSDDEYFESCSGPGDCAIDDSVGDCQKILFACRTADPTALVCL